MTEWRSIPGFTRYSVSNDGQVRRDVRLHNSVPGPVARSAEGRMGYPKVALTDDAGRYCTRYVHSLIAEAFIGPRPPGHVVRHKDGNGSNCTLDNIEYGTPAQNVSDAIAHGTQVRGERQHLAKLDVAKVTRIVDLLSAGVTGRAIAEQFGVTNATITQIRTGKTWRHVTGGAVQRANLVAPTGHERPSDSQRLERVWGAL